MAEAPENAAKPLRLLAWLSLVLGVLCWLAAFGFWFAAIWTHGPDAYRVGCTGALGALVGSVLGALGAWGVFA